MWTALRARRLTVLVLALVAAFVVERSPGQSVRSDNSDPFGAARWCPDTPSPVSQSGGRRFDPGAVHQLTRIAGLQGQRWGSGASASTSSRPLSGPEAVTLTLSLPDTSGRASAEFSPGPQVLYLGEGQTVTDYLLVVPVQATLCSVRSFLAWDAGSLGEAGFDLTIRGTRIAERSAHKERPENYDGWLTHAARFDLVAGDELHLQTRASQTAPRTVDGGRSTRIEFAWRLTLSLTGRCEQ